MRQIRIGLAQIRCEKGAWTANLARAGAYLAAARAAGCDLVVFPEMGLSGYCDPTRFPDSVQPLDAAGVREFVRLTAQHGVAASGGFIEANPGGKPFITQVLAQAGQIVGVYRKNHVVDEEAALFAPGQATPVFRLQAAGGEIPCALAVCADSDRPDLFAAFAGAGARVVFHSSAPGLYTRRTDAASWQAGHDWYQGYLFARLPAVARTHRLPIAVATQTGATVDEDFPGGSFVFGADGTVLAGTAGPAETLLVHDLTIPE